MLVNCKQVRLLSDEESHLHPLYHSFRLLPPGRRYRAPLARKNIYVKSFIPPAIAALNKNRLLLGTNLICFTSSFTRCVVYLTGVFVFWVVFNA